MGQNVLLSSVHCHTYSYATDHQYTCGPIAWYNLTCWVRLWISPVCHNKGSRLFMWRQLFKKKRKHTLVSTELITVLVLLMEWAILLIKKKETPY